MTVICKCHLILEKGICFQNFQSSSLLVQHSASHTCSSVSEKVEQIQQAMNISPLIYALWRSVSIWQAFPQLSSAFLILSWLWCQVIKSTNNTSLPMHSTQRRIQKPFPTLPISAQVCHMLSSIACDTTLGGRLLSNMIWDDWKLFDLKVYSLKLSALRDHQENLIASLREKSRFSAPNDIRS